MTLTHQSLTRSHILQIVENERKAQGLSIAKTERKAGVPKDTLRDFGRGKAYIMRPDKLQKVLNILGYDLQIVRLKKYTE